MVIAIHKIWKEEEEEQQQHQKGNKKKYMWMCIYEILGSFQEHFLKLKQHKFVPFTIKEKKNGSY